MIRIVTIFLLSVGIFSGCAEFDRMTKPRVEGLYKDTQFDQASLREGGVGDIQVSISLTNSQINPESLKPMLAAAIRSKRPDLSITSSGNFEITANVIADDISKRESDLEGTIYKWTKRRVKINYVVTDNTTQKQVWTGIIQTYEEPMASYEKKEKKSTDKVLDAVAAKISKTEQQPYPSKPVFSDVAKLNFEGFALNLPFEK